MQKEHRSAYDEVGPERPGWGPGTVIPTFVRLARFLAPNQVSPVRFEFVAGVLGYPAEALSAWVLMTGDTRYFEAFEPGRVKRC